MAAKSKIFGSTLSVGLENDWQDRATVRIFVDDLTPNAPDNQIQAILSAVDLVQTTHEELANLPLQLATARIIGPTKAWVTCRYGRRRYSPLTQDSFVSVKFRSAYENVEHYSTGYTLPAPSSAAPTFIDGMPQGQALHDMSNALLTDPTKHPKPYRWRRPVVRIYVTARLSTNPLGAVDQFLNTTNADAFLLGGVSFAAETVRFDGLNIDSAQRRNVVTIPPPMGDGNPQFELIDRWDVQYAFTATPDLFLKEHAYFDEGAGNWATSITQQYRPAWVGTDFPT